MNDKRSYILDESVLDLKTIKLGDQTDRDRAAAEFAVQVIKHDIGARNQMLECLKKIFDVERDGPKGRKGAITRRKKMQAWQDYARKEVVELRKKNPALTPSDLAEKLRSKSSPVTLPSHERLVRFIRDERKSGSGAGDLDAN